MHCVSVVTTHMRRLALALGADSNLKHIISNTGVIEFPCLVPTSIRIFVQYPKLHMDATFVMFLAKKADPVQ